MCLKKEGRRFGIIFLTSRKTMIHMWVTKSNVLDHRKRRQCEKVTQELIKEMQTGEDGLS